MTHRAGSPLRSEAGISVVEVLVAVLIFAIGLLAVLGTLDASTRNTFRVEQTQTATNMAQQQLEEIRNLPYDQVAMRQLPAHSSDPANPFYRVNGGAFDLDWDPVTRTGSDPADVVVDNVNGGVTPSNDAWQSGDASGRLFRFVVWRNDPHCSSQACPGSHDYKRIVVIVTIDTVPAGSARSYVELQSDFSDPDATATSTSDPGGGDPVTAQQFFLTDTSCRQTSETAPAGDHAVHNTLGACGGSGANPPDGLFSVAPADPDPSDPSNPPLYDYATDPALEPSADPSADRGLQMLRQDQNGCDFSGGSSSPEYRVHRWVSLPVPQPFVMSRSATLDFYTGTINDVNVPGGICVWLFVRTETDQGGVTDRLLADASHPSNTYFTFTQNPWPRGAWIRRTLPMSYSSTTLDAGQRIGLAIAVRREDTPEDALELMYDHPDYPSRLEVQTTTPF